MCHDDDSVPPPAPRAEPVSVGGAFHLTSADGTRFMAYRAAPQRTARAGVVVLPDVRGLHAFYQRFTERLAGAGLAAVAIDYYGRVLPDGPRDRPMHEMFPLVGQLSPEQVAADAGAAVDQLRAEHGLDTVFALGFCYGGSQAWTLSALDDRLAGCIGFYGRPDDSRPYVERMRVPLLVLAAGDDALTPPADNLRFDAELTAAGVRHDFVLYDGVPHAFFDGELGFADECGDAWRRVLDFVDAHTPARS